MNQPLKYVVLLFCFVAWLFFLIGCISYADDTDTVKNVAWIVYKSGGDEAWYALHKYTFNIQGVKSSSVYKDCSGSLCDQCERDGNAAFGLLIVALVFSTFSTVLSLAMLNSTTPKAMASSNAVCCFIAFVTSLIAVAVFMGECYNKVEDTVQNEDKLTWGAGAVLSIIGMFLMVGALLALVIAFAADLGSSSQA